MVALFQGARAENTPLSTFQKSSRLAGLFSQYNHQGS
jgi:hypothetical protein